MERDSIAALGLLHEELPRVVDSVWERHNVMLQQSFDAPSELLLQMLGLKRRAEPKTVDGEMSEVELRLATSPEPVLEFQKQPAGGIVEVPKQVEVKQQFSPCRFAELKENGVPANLPRTGGLKIGGQEDVEEPEGGKFVSLRNGVVEVIAVIGDARQAIQAVPKRGVLATAARR